MSQIYNFFPLSIFRNKINLSEDVKNKMINEIKNMKNLSSNNKLEINKASWTGDMNGHEYLYKNDKFDMFFSQVEKNIKEYLSKFELDLDQVDIYFQRAWATFSGINQNIFSHFHAQSHLSFAYYLKKNKEDSNLILIDKHKHNEFIPLVFTSQSVDERKLFNKRNIMNVAKIKIDAEEDDIIIFPSKTIHATEENKNNNERISISADITIVAKNAENLEYLMPPLSEWKKFS